MNLYFLNTRDHTVVNDKFLPCLAHAMLPVAMKYHLTLSLLFMITIAFSQDELPYYNIPEAPEDHTPGSVLARMADGLGFRYHWATEGLREEDLAYQPTEESRSSGETLEHLLDLSNGIMKTAQGLPVTREYDVDEMSFEEIRALTLSNIETASEAFRGKSEEEIAALQVVFQRGDEQYPYPIWNLMNGQIADALTHVGQITSFRRTSGNPQPSGVNVFMGTKR